MSPQDKILNRVRGLLAKAEDPAATPHEEVGKVRSQGGGTVRSKQAYEAGQAAANRADVGTQRFQGARKALR